MKQEMIGWQWHQHLITQFFTGQMLFLTPNQQCQSTEGKTFTVRGCWNSFFLFCKHAVFILLLL